MFYIMYCTGDEYNGNILCTVQELDSACNILCTVHDLDTACTIFCTVQERDTACAILSMY